jgi:hypothetical protein
MTGEQLAQIVTVPQCQRLACPCCGADDRLTARESAFDPLALPLAAGDLRLDIQRMCKVCGKLVRLRVYEQADALLIRVRRMTLLGTQRRSGMRTGSALREPESANHTMTHGHGIFVKRAVLGNKRADDV